MAYENLFGRKETASLIRQVGEDFMPRNGGKPARGFQPVRGNRTGSPRYVPAWAEPNKEAENLFRQMLLRSFPNWQTRERDRKGAARWVRIRQLFYICHKPQSEVAAEIGVSVSVVKNVLRDMRNAGEGLTTNGRKRRLRGRPLVWKEEGSEDAFQIVDSDGNPVPLDEFFGSDQKQIASNVITVTTVQIESPRDHKPRTLLMWLLTQFLRHGKPYIPATRMLDWIKIAGIPERSLARVKKSSFTVGHARYIYSFDSKKPNGTWSWCLLNRHNRPVRKRELAILRQAVDGSGSRYPISIQRPASSSKI
jgi:hypothetical protein